MSFRIKHKELYKDNQLGLSRTDLNNHELYNAFRGIASRVMCDMYNLNVDNCDKITQDAIDYRENLLDAMICTVMVYNDTKCGSK